MANLALRGQWSQQGALGQMAHLTFAHLLRNLLCVASSSQKRLSSCVLLPNLAPPEDRAPSACLRDACLVWHRTSVIAGG